MSDGRKKVMGLLGRTLCHSYSPEIHRYLGEYEYRLFEKSPDEVEDFIKNGCWQGLNVTIPYKKRAAELCDSLSKRARLLGSVNTLVRGEDGGIHGYNTDYAGFMSMVQRLGVGVEGKKALVLGSGGASVTCVRVLKDLGAVPVVISRSGEDNYANLYRHEDASVIVNATPVGMYPDTQRSPVELTRFKDCRAVLDLIYNPLRTRLLLEASSLNIPCSNGLHMLVAQASESSFLFTGKKIPGDRILEVERLIKTEKENILLIGMPGCGKSEIAGRLGIATGRRVIESDRVVEEMAKMPIPEIFATAGEAGFRELETRALAEITKLSGVIISTGGGCVTREENYPLLRSNSKIVYLKRALEHLSTEQRPLSQSRGTAALYRERKPLYEALADITVSNDSTPEDAAKRILSLISAWE